ncbi:hypothetical protein GT625_06835 [Burkholderia thailandensis]|nr:hypothetical protein [Burkholderia thailandensis]NBJ18452.1 hypothetical protein [Burkholderia thailandensis]PHH33884.1 hypothetical protein CRX59_24740 [Burkholderia thailandensis]PNE72027.1 hypothetical protein A8H38_07960 [Burkholderia thailandensis]PNE84191.1 hypothetical protein A8H34_08750 [Burkholderia thailandensis]
MTHIYSNPNQQEAEAIAIRRMIRASNAEQMARRRASDAADVDRPRATLKRIGRVYSIVRLA